MHNRTDVCPVQWHGDQAVVTLPEQIDVSNAGQIREELLWVINRGAAALVADMTATISCDHVGADAVARAYQRAVVSGTGLRLVVTAQIVRRVLSLGGLDRLVSIYPSLEAAMAVTAPAARVPLTLVGSPAGTGAGGRQASRPQADAPPGHGGPASGRARPAGPPPAPDTAVTPAMIWEMAESFPAGVALADGHGAITLASRRLEDMFGYGHAELTGSSIERLVPSDRQAAHRGHRSRGLRRRAAVVCPRAAGGLLVGSARPRHRTAHTSLTRPARVTAGTPKPAGKPGRPGPGPPLGWGPCQRPAGHDIAAAQR